MGAGGRCSADHRPAGGVRHAYHGGLFAADVGAGVVAAVFTLPVVRPGAPAAPSFRKSNQKVLLALCGAFIFVLSALKIPSVTGSCSHPTGVGLAVILFGPGVVAVLGAIVLLFQALLLAHGGLTTLGANGMSMAVIGPMVGYLVWKLACRAGIRRDVGVFLCAMLADLMTYFVTSVQLGVAFPDPATGAGGSIAKFMGIFCLTQIPIAIAEGLLTVMIYDQLTKRRLIAAEGH